jgi:hypothetical protein
MPGESKKYPPFHSSSDGRGETSGYRESAKGKGEDVLGVLLLILPPVFLFVRPITKAASLRDLLLVIWWAFIL